MACSSDGEEKAFHISFIHRYLRSEKKERGRRELKILHITGGKEEKEETLISPTIKSPAKRVKKGGERNPTGKKRKGERRVNERLKSDWKSKETEECMRRGGTRKKKRREKKGGGKETLC